MFLWAAPIGGGPILFGIIKPENSKKFTLRVCYSRAQRGMPSRAMDRDIAIILHYERTADDRYYIRSESVPGLRLVGPDIDALQRDLDPVVKHLLQHNMGVELLEPIRWLPSPDDIKRHLQNPELNGNVTYTARVKDAA